MDEGLEMWLTGKEPVFTFPATVYKAKPSGICWTPSGAVLPAAN